MCSLIDYQNVLLIGPSVETSLDVISQEAFIAEIKRLRERLVTLETENATLNMKLSQQQWEVSEIFE